MAVATIHDAFAYGVPRWHGKVNFLVGVAGVAQLRLWFDQLFLTAAMDLVARETANPCLGMKAESLLIFLVDAGVARGAIGGQREVVIVSRRCHGKLEWVVGPVLSQSRVTVQAGNVRFLSARVLDQRPVRPVFQRRGVIVVALYAGGGEFVCPRNGRH